MTAEPSLPEGWRVVHYVEAVCPGDKGPGGWAVTRCLMNGDRLARQSPFSKSAPYEETPLRLEIRAIIEALWQSEGKGERNEVCTRNPLIAHALTNVAPFRATEDDFPVTDRELWLELFVTASERNVTWRLLDADEPNEIADGTRRLAAFAANKAAELYRRAKETA